MKLKRAVLVAATIGTLFVPVAARAGWCDMASKAGGNCIGCNIACLAETSFELFWLQGW